MSTFSASRSVAIQHFLHSKTRPFLKPISRETLRAFHITAIDKADLNTQEYLKRKEIESERKAQEAKARQIGLKGQNIPYERVRVRFLGGLSDTRLLSDVLDEVKALNAEEVEQAKDTEASSPSSYKIKRRYEAELVLNDPFPIVAIIDAKAAFEKKKRTQEKVKSSSVHNVRKEIQLTWASSAADVKNRLERMKDDLQKGYKIDLAISPKKSVPLPGGDEMQERMQEIVSQFAGIAREWRQREYTRTTAVAYLQGIAAPSAPIQVDVKKVPKGVLLKQERRQKEEERKKKKQEREAQFQEAVPELY